MSPGTRAGAPEGVVEAGALDHLLQVGDGVLVVEVGLGEEPLHLDAVDDEVVVHGLHGEGIEPPLGRAQDDRARRSAVGGGLGLRLGRARLLHDVA